MGISNLESRIVKLENTAKTEFGTPVSAIFFPVRKLMLAEERSHDEDGVAFPVLVATWDKPAGVLLPDSIRLIHNDTTVSLPGTATSYRMTGYAVDATVSVKVTAIYAQGNSSTIIAEKTISGDIEPPSVPTNLTVTGGFRTLTLRWENPTTEDFSHVEIWESVIGPDVVTSERIAQAYGTEFVRSNCGVLETRWYWIRALDANGNFSDFTSVASGTTTAIAMEDVPENTISESMLISELASEINKIPAIEVNVNLINQELDAEAAQRLLLAAKVDNNLSAIQNEATARANADSALSTNISTVSAVANAKNKTYRQASAPTTGMTTGDLWFDSDANNKAYRYSGSSWVATDDTRIAANTAAIQTEQTARANADSAMASQITTLQGTVGNNTAAIQIVEDVRMGEVNVFRQASAPTTGMITGDLWIDNTEVVHRYEGGEWVSKVGTPVYDLLKTAIAQYVVKTQTVTGDGQLKVAGFGLYNDSTTGSEFAVLADKFYVYGQKADGSSYSNIQVFTVDTTTTPPTVGINGNLIVDGSIAGEKIYAGAKIQLGDGGEIITGANTLVQMASGVITLDTEEGIIQVKDPGNTTTGDYIAIEVGDITSYKYLDGAYRSMKSLRKMEVGSGINGSTITLPGNWPSQPKIQVSPNSLQSYNKDYPSQNQELVTYADFINYNNTTGVVTFIPRAYLQIAAGGSSVSLPVAVKDVGFTYKHNPQQAIPGTFITATYSTIPSGATNIVIKAKIYAQDMIVAGESAIFRTVKITVTAYIGGTSYTVGSATFAPKNYDISSEPTRYYVEVSTTVSSGSGNVYLSAYIENPSGYVDKSFSTGNFLNCAKGWLRFDSLQYSLSSSTQLATGTLNYIAIAE